ncbi:MAG: hypothetical protein PHH40_00900 [Candidatus Moranbacteria bacterium]|nr:hypothetical protein [Candidatus Moranbacteria bacterium]MDD3964872.1 hypothetical protein [Candidatus Moranbacteria bacterium]
MTAFVPFEPGMEGHFVPYEAVEEGLVVISDDDQQQQPTQGDSSQEQKNSE